MRGGLVKFLAVGPLFRVTLSVSKIGAKSAHRKVINSQNVKKGYITLTYSEDTRTVKTIGRIILHYCVFILNLFLLLFSKLSNHKVKIKIN